MKLLSPLRAAARSVWKGSRLEIALVAVAAPLALCTFLTLPAITGCATSPSGLAAEQKIYTIATNIVAAGLTAWNVHQPASLPRPRQPQRLA